MKKRVGLIGAILLGAAMATVGLSSGDLAQAQNANSLKVCDKNDNPKSVTDILFPSQHP